MIASSGTGCLCYNFAFYLGVGGTFVMGGWAFCQTNVYFMLAFSVPDVCAIESTCLFTGFH